jgi:deoxyhypusine synthase
LIKKPAAKKPTTTAKKAAKKIPAKKTAKKEWDSRFFWLSGKVEEQSINLDKAIAIMELIQEANIFPGYQGNALWAAVDIVEKARNDLDELTNELMWTHREVNNIKPVKL